MMHGISRLQTRLSHQRTTEIVKKSGACRGIAFGAPCSFASAPIAPHRHRRRNLHVLRGELSAATYPAQVVALCLLLIAPGVLGQEFVRESVRVRLRGSVEVSGNTIRLADVLDLSTTDDPLVQRVAESPLFAEPPADFPGTVTHAAVVARLGELGLDMSRVLVGGAGRCQIRRAPIDQAASAPLGDADPAVAARRAVPAAPAGERALADLIRDYAVKELADLGGKPEVVFERAGQEFLQLTTPPWDLSISSAGGEKLGLREFRVVIAKDGQRQRRVSVFAQVRLSKPVVVAARPLNPGNPVRAGDLKLETRVFDRMGPCGVSQMDGLVGQEVKRFVAAGEMVQPDVLKPVDLVTRSRPVTVLSNNANVQVRMSGTALDSGRHGETIRVRVGDARRARQVLRGIVTGPGTVRLAEDSTP